MKKILLLMFICLTVALHSGESAGDTRYDAGMNLPFNQKAGDVNPQTGNITIGATDVSLPGRAGFNFSFGRVWSLNQSNVFNMYYKNGENKLNSNTVEKHNKLGAGWNTSLPYISKDEDSYNTSLNLFFNGSVYSLDKDNLTKDEKGRSNILGYTLTDKRVYQKYETGYEHFGNDKLVDLIFRRPDIDILDNKINKYVVHMKTGEKSYFRKDGKLMMSQDRSGINKIWYFYNSKSQLILVVDSVSREIVFSYNLEGKISSISWDVEVGKKFIDNKREIVKETRSVFYKYKRIDSYGSILDFNRSVVDYIEPYALEKVINPMGHVTKYDYRLGEVKFTYDSKDSIYKNCHLLLTEISNVYTVDGKFLNKRILEYEPPAIGNYKKFFFKGYIEYFKISKSQYLDKTGREMSPVYYEYYEKGGKNRNCYTTIIKSGNVKTTYYYNQSNNVKTDHLLDKIVVETKDGFHEEKDYSYDSNKAMAGIVVKHGSKIAYSEDFEHDINGNLLKHYNSSSELQQVTVYDNRFNIPKSQTLTLNKSIDNKIEQHESKSTINNLGQVTKQELKVDGVWIPVKSINYDEFGNLIEVIDANNNSTHTVYDRKYNLFPVKTYQDVTLPYWDVDSISDKWIKPPTGNKKMRMRSWKVFNTDGSIWIEVDNEGYAIEHYYDKAGTEIETITPDENDYREFAKPAIITNTGVQGNDFTNFFKNPDFNTFLNSRKGNPGVSIEIDYQNAYTRSVIDIDIKKGLVKITGGEGDGLGNTLKEIVYNLDGTEYSVKEIQYDTFGRMVALTDPDAENPPTDFSLQNSIVKKTDKTWLIYYDDMSRQTFIRYPKTRDVIDIKEISYDDINNSIRVTDPEGRVSEEYYDWSGNLIKVILYGDDGNNETTLFDYDSKSRKIRLTDSMGLVTEYYYSEMDLLTRQRFLDTGYDYSDFMKYDKVGRLTKNKDRKGQIISFKYDELGRNTITKHYKDELHFEKNIESYRVNQAYDNRGNAIRIESENLIEHYTYDSKNSVLQLDRYLKDKTLRDNFDSTKQIYSFSYTYNDAGMVKNITYPDGKIHTFEYNELSYLKGIKENGNPFVNNIEYMKSGVISKMSYANGAKQTWSFDNRKRINGIRIGTSSKVYADLKYTLNGVGNVLKINDNEYDYDGFNRIKWAKSLIPQRLNQKNTTKLVADSFGSFTGDMEFNEEADLVKDGRINGPDHIKSSIESMNLEYDEESFLYDKNGNRVKLIQNGDEYIYTYGVRNQLKEIKLKKKGTDILKPFASYVYDKNGNTIKRTYHTISEGNITEFKYDSMNRLIKTITDGVVSSTNIYDNAGNRLVKESEEGSTLYLRHGQVAVAMDIEVPKKTVAYIKKENRYILSGDLLAGRITTTYKKDNIQAIESFYYHLDHLNSTKAVTNADGSLDCIYEYRAFGEELKKIGSGDAKYTFGGKELDNSTNLYYFNARFYDATIGRFINVDPIQDGTNWYLYCSNNPLSFKDPTGLYKEADDGLSGVIEKGDTLTKIVNQHNEEWGSSLTVEEVAKFNNIEDVDLIHTGDTIHFERELWAAQGIEVTAGVSAVAGNTGAFEVHGFTKMNFTNGKRSFNQDYSMETIESSGLNGGAGGSFLPTDAYRYLPKGISNEKVAQQYEGLFYSKSVSVFFCQSTVFDGGGWKGHSKGVTLSIGTDLVFSRSFDTVDYKKVGEIYNRSRNSNGKTFSERGVLSPFGQNSAINSSENNSNIFGPSL